MKREAEMAEGDGRRSLMHLMRTPSVQTLLLYNALPLLGVVVLGWDASGPVTAYCFEAVVLGLFYLPRILFGQGGRPFERFMSVLLIGLPYLAVTVGLLGFTAQTFFGNRDGFTVLMITPEKAWALAEATAGALGGAWLIATVAMAVFHHGRSFLVSFWWGTERGTNYNLFVFALVVRAAATLLLVVPGGFFLYFHDSSAWLLGVLVLFKVAADLTSHVQAHRATAPGGVRM